MNVQINPFHSKMESDEETATALVALPLFFF